MQKYLIIGNGFDLHHHLPTKYEHFIQVLKTVENLKENTAEYSFIEVFDNIDESFKKSIKKSYHTENIKFAKDDILLLQNLVKNNVWFHCFKQIVEIDTWIDFELHIERILNVINEVFKKSSQFIELNRNKSRIAVSCDSLSQNFGIEINSSQFKTLLDLEIIEPTASPGNGNLGSISTDYLLIQNNSIYALDEKLILERLAYYLDEFIQIFNLYLSKIIEPLYANYKGTELIKNGIGRNAKIFSLNYNFFSDGYKFETIYSFNYTPTLTKYYESEQVRYLHGRCGSNQNIVLGINDIMDKLKEHKMFAFTKYYQKLFKNTDYRFLDDDIEHKTFTNIYIWGHSLDVSDGEYISKIFSLLKENKGYYKVIIFYHNNLARASQLQNLLKLMDKEPIEQAMKKGQLVFLESNNENLLQMIMES